MGFQFLKVYLWQSMCIELKQIHHSQPNKSMQHLFQQIAYQRDMIGWESISPREAVEGIVYFICTI